MSGRSLNKFAWLEALRGAELTHAEYRVLVNLSTYARGDLTNAHPGLTRLAVDAHVTEGTAKKALRSLVAKGWLVLTDPGGNAYWRGKANVYALSIPKGVTELPPWGEEKGVNRHTEGGQSGTEGGQSTPSEGGHSVTPQQEELSGDSINGFKSRGVVALGNARAGERVREDPLPPEIASEQADAAFGELFDDGFPAAAPEPIWEPIAPTPSAPEVDPAVDPLAWIENELPDGFRGAERAQAEKRIEEGGHYSTIRWDIVRARNARPKVGRRRHQFVDDSQTTQEAQ
ncbi:hypothetical protein I0Q12_00155 [Rhodococcus sp. CX]|uniref:hypothetical protein n=1 Tax=Rhodococcus sp. CX TaxID=2789880 RepID=UPI0018CD8539|nr:hypothetical protein [Rhodococcus sp. CX]MBH0118028.1 hypothetical protein [Rhodococcus sp. CX]